MKKPSLLSEKDKYNLQPSDFESRFERYIFIAILNSYTNGAQTLSEIDIDNYLMEHKDQYLLFQQNNGISYLQDALDMSTPENFEYYYNRIKKFNCLKDLKKSGFDISEFYEENELNPRQFEINQRFETLKPKDIFDGLKRRIYKVEGEYVEGDTSITTDISVGIDELLEKLKNSPDAGARFQGKYFNTVTRGARKGKYYIVSFPSGGGKTRLLLGEACYLAFPMRYSWETMEWKITGNAEKTLFIATEQAKEEIQTMVVAYLTGINEDVILYGHFTKEQQTIIDQAKEVIKKYKNNLMIVQIPMPSVEIVKSVIRQNCIVNDIKNVFFDYIFSNPALLNEFRDLRIREDVALLMLSTALKDLAVEQDVFMMSATQLNSSQDTNEKGIKNQNSIRGSKSIVDKADIAMIGGLVPDDQRDQIAPYVAKYGMPTQVYDVYKVRRGKWTNLKIWSNVDLGTCRRSDVFVTDSNIKEIEVPIMEVNFDDNYGQYDEFVHHLNSSRSLPSRAVQTFSIQQDSDLDSARSESTETEEDEEEMDKQSPYYWEKVVEENNKKGDLFGGLL
nr:MAG TPA: replicative helicase [Caudoviricetes sp.]